jgi:hypothetical protein
MVRRAGEFALPTVIGEAFNVTCSKGEKLRPENRNEPGGKFDRTSRLGGSK